MKNVEFTKGSCSICGGTISERWAGKNPSLGTVCENCFNKQDNRFGPENVEIVVQKHLRFDPLLGIYEYHFDWKGSRIMVNGKIGTITSPQGDGDFVRFEDEETKGLGTFIEGVGYWDLLRIYKAQGGRTDPPVLNIEPYVPKKADLLGEPILAVKVEIANGRIHCVKVGNKSINAGIMFAAAELPNLPTLHAFANLYMRYKFGLAPNFCAEGGFMGKNFEIRNAGSFIGGCGLTVCSDTNHRVLTLEAFRNLVVEKKLLSMAIDREQSRMKILFDPDADLVLSTWVRVMETLLRYDWRELTFNTVEDIWKHYCRIQDVLLNIMPAEELAEALVYARENKMRHYGSSY